MEELGRVQPPGAQRAGGLRDGLDLEMAAELI
jgi:hypothetical protein